MQRPQSYNSNRRRSRMDTADLMQQPFEVSKTRDMVFKFNGKNQKKTPKRKKK